MTMLLLHSFAMLFPHDEPSLNREDHDVATCRFPANSPLGISLFLLGIQVSKWIMSSYNPVCFVWDPGYSQVMFTTTSMPAMPGAPAKFLPMIPTSEEPPQSGS